MFGGVGSNGYTTLPVNFVDGAGRRLPPIDRVRNTDSEDVISDRMDLLTHENQRFWTESGKPFSRLSDPRMVVRRQCNRIEATPPSLDDGVPRRKQGPTQRETMDVKIRGKNLITAHCQ